MHAPYRWGAKGQSASKDGPRLFDCSGLVTWAFHQVGGKDWRATHNTDRLCRSGGTQAVRSGVGQAERAGGCRCCARVALREASSC
ncbi:NlpC/P60 family protein [Corallococcus exercitus]|nr:NlpC/P60 family protein [Corallococcus exercitus]